jgi:hypothetical protein
MAPSDFAGLADKVISTATRSLGRVVIYKPKKGGEYSINAVFDDRALSVDPHTEQVVQSNIYTLGVRLADLPDPPAKGDLVIIGALAYRVVDSNEDGVPGVSAVLGLHKV